MFISAWTRFSNLGKVLKGFIAAGDIAATDTVWQGPDGSVVVAPTAGHLDDEYADYVDEGLVSEYVD